MRNVLNAVQSISKAAWDTGIAQAAMKQLFHWLYLLLRWCIAHPGGVLGGLFAGWLAHLAGSVPWTHVIMNWALGPLGMPIFYIIIIGAGVIYGAGIIEFRRPFDR